MSIQPQSQANRSTAAKVAVEITPFAFQTMRRGKFMSTHKLWRETRFCWVMADWQTEYLVLCANDTLTEATLMMCKPNGVAWEVQADPEDLKVVFAIHKEVRWWAMPALELAGD